MDTIVSIRVGFSVAVDFRAEFSYNIVISHKWGKQYCIITPSLETDANRQKEIPDYGIQF